MALNDPATSLEVDLDTMDEAQLLAAIEALRNSRFEDIERLKKHRAKSSVKNERIKKSGSRAAMSIEELAEVAGMKLTPETIEKLRALLAKKGK